MRPRHFLTLSDLEPAELRRVVARAIELKAARGHARGAPGDAVTATPGPLAGRVLGLLFEKSSTRTRVALETAMLRLGGGALFLSPRDTQLGRGEPIEDTARVLSRMLDVIAVRTYEHDKLERFAACSEVPVINALTDRFHPCQVLADVQTFVEHRGDIAGRTVAWVGDGNNMCNSFIRAAGLFDFRLRIACPPGYEPPVDVMAPHRERVSLVEAPEAAVADADLVVTDVWASMGQEGEQGERVRRFAPYQLNAALLAGAGPDALVMHCLPAHRGEEITADVLEGPQSVVWDEAENRLHSHQALLEFLLRSG